MTKEKMLTDLVNVHDFLVAIDDPCAESVAYAAAVISGEAEMRTAARLLTLEEVRESKGFLWVENRETHWLIKGVLVKMDKNAVMIFNVRRPGRWIYDYSALFYGSRFRCWASRPTEEEMAATPWEEETEEEVSGDER